LTLSRRDDSDPLREARYQDFRFYRRALATEEVARLPAEDVAAEVIARQSDPAKWTTDETFVVAEKFFLGQVDAEAKKITADLTVLDNRIDVLTRSGAPDPHHPRAHPAGLRRYSQARRLFLPRPTRRSRHALLSPAAPGRRLA